MKTIFLDSDVIIDLLQQRKPFESDAISIFQQIEMGNIVGCTSSLAIANIYYLLCKLKTKKTALSTIKKITAILQISDVNQDVIIDSLNSKFRDFEDASQHFSAKKFGADFIVTRNLRDYKHSTTPVYSPREAIDIILTNP